MEKNMKKIYMYAFVTKSLCCTPETNTTLYLNCTPIKKFLQKKQKWTNET